MIKRAVDDRVKTVLEMRATLPVRAIADDIDNVAEPITILGKQHHAWVGDRGLPNAFDHHDKQAGAGRNCSLTERFDSSGLPAVT